MRSSNGQVYSKCETNNFFMNLEGNDEAKIGEMRRHAVNEHRGKVS